MQQPHKIMPMAIALMVFPQMAQTLYSPALADFQQAFNVAPALASQALTVYFVAFAFGVVAWGIGCDRFGRRTAMLCGLAVFATASLAAMAVRTFEALMACQALAAFGAAVGSVVTQTILRDRFTGAALAKVFSIVGMALAASPALGLLVGTFVVQLYGYAGVMLVLAVTATLLGTGSAIALPETQLASALQPPFQETLRALMRDAAVWRAAALVAVFNIALLSYYATGPFIFQRLGWSATTYGYTGAVLALGAALGAWISQHLLKLNVGSGSLITAASATVVLAGVGLLMARDSLWFLLPLLASVMAYGLAIPNVLSQALARYQDRLGTAGALFGLLYYLMIGVGMGGVGMAQNFGGCVLLCGAVALILCVAPKARPRRKRGRL